MVKYVMGTDTSYTNDRTYHSFQSQPAAGFTFPNTDTLTYTWDALYRRTEIDDGSSVAKWFFFGPDRVAEVKLGNDLICTHMNNARTNSAVQSDVSNPSWGGQSSDRLGYDGAGRRITKRYLDATASASGYTSTSAKVGFTTRYDHASNKDYERHLHAESRSSLYPARDSLNRLREYQRGTLEENDDGSVSVDTAIALPSTDAQRSYDLDGVGNWQKTIYTPVGGGATTQVRRHNGVNQLTRFGATDVTYDHGDNTGDDARQGSGNIVDDGRREYLWDALNRLVQVTDKDKTSPNDVVAVYTYDAAGRRIRKVVTNGGIPSDSGLNGTLDFLYTGVQCIEERNGSDAAQRQYIWGTYIDELIRQDELVGGSPPVYYPLTDLLYRNVGLTDSSKAFQEAYDTDAYGNTLIFDAAGSGSNWFADDAGTTTDPKCCFLFTGRRYDPETQIYFYRARYYHPALGRFLSRDPVGYVDRMNLYEYVRSQPLRYTDSAGLYPIRILAMSDGVHEDMSSLAALWAGFEYDYLTEPKTRFHRGLRIGSSWPDRPDGTKKWLQFFGLIYVSGLSPEAALYMSRAWNTYDSHYGAV